MVHQIVIYLAIFILCVLADSKEIQLNPQVVGGRNANIQDHPYIVSLRGFGLYHFCGGSIYSSKIVITACHCMVSKNIEDITVVAGSTYLSEAFERRSVRKAVLHPNFSQRTMDYDVAIILLDEPWIFNDLVKPIELVRFRPADGVEVMVAGWGFKQMNSGNSYELQEASLRLVSDKYCRIKYTPVKPVTSRMVCADSNDGKDACQNDSGGPLTYQNKLLGIVSFGVDCASGYPGVYTSVPGMWDWIYDNSKNLEERKM